jgi:hypothetical protein
MREYQGAAMNILLAETADRSGFQGLAEIITLHSEPRYTRLDGEVVRTREIGETRVMFRADGLRAHAKHMLEYADALDAAEARLTTPGKD